MSADRGTFPASPTPAWLAFRLGLAVADLSYSVAWSYLSAGEDGGHPPPRVGMVRGELTNLCSQLTATSNEPGVRTACEALQHAAGMMAEGLGVAWLSDQHRAWIEEREGLQAEGVGPMPADEAEGIARSPLADRWGVERQAADELAATLPDALRPLFALGRVVGEVIHPSECTLRPVEDPVWRLHGELAGRVHEHLNAARGAWPVLSDLPGLPVGRDAGGGVADSDLYWAVAALELSVSSRLASPPVPPPSIRIDAGPASGQAPDRTGATPVPPPLSPTFDERCRLLDYLRAIDPDGKLVGESVGCLRVVASVRVFAHSQGRAILLLGETGVGKSALAEAVGRGRALAAQTTVSPPTGNAGAEAGVKPKAKRRKGGGSDTGKQGDAAMPISPPFHRWSGSRSGAGDPTGPRAEWVGYAKGSGYSGVDRNGVDGILKRHRGGTIFVDEFGDLSEDVQTLLLDVAEGKKVSPVGTKGEPFDPDVRLVFATNKAVGDAIRADLLERVGITVTIPPLRERIEDVFPLVASILKGTDFRLGFRTWELFHLYGWPGNVRQLKSVLDTAVARARIESADAAHGSSKGPASGNKAGRGKSERRVLPFHHFTEDPRLAETAEGITMSEEQAEGGVLRRLHDILVGWEYKPKSRKGGYALYAKMAQLLGVAPSWVTNHWVKNKPEMEAPTSHG